MNVGLMMQSPSKKIRLRLEERNIRLRLKERVFDSAFCIIDMRVVQYDQIEGKFVKHIVGWARQGFNKIIAKCTFRLVVQSPRLRAKAKCNTNLSRNPIGSTNEGLRKATAILK